MKKYIFILSFFLSVASFAQNNIPQLVSADKYQPLVNAQNQVSNGVQQPITTQKPLTLFGPTPTQKPIPTPKPTEISGTCVVGSGGPCNETQTPTPTQKPVALLEYLIKTYTNENETVLDFTFGSCSTGVAALNTNRKFLGVEMDEGYFDIGVKRMQESTIKGEK